jgi:hypothetical protein
MATIVNQPQARRDIWQALKELDFLSAFFSWFFLLLTRLSEPLMLLATLYIIAEAGVPAIAFPAVHNLAIGVMITAPEIILPGSFVVASRTQEHGGQHARMLFAVCWLFVLLTLVTLVSLFVWHLSGTSLAWLMCGRCAAAVGYSILMRVMSHGRDQVQMVSLPSLTERLTEIEVTLQQRTTEQIAETEQRITATLQELIQELSRTSNEQKASPDLIDITEILQGLPALLDEMTQSTHTQVRQAMQEVKTMVEANTGRPKLALVESPNPKSRANTGTNEFDKGAFVRSCLTEYPTIRNSEIQRKASELGHSISPGYISDIRKAFLEEESA